MKYMKYINKFENTKNTKFKMGDYVYPKPEYCKSRFNVLKPIKYKILTNRFRFNSIWVEVDQIDTSKHDNIFPEDYFMTEFEYLQYKYNL